MLKRNLCLFLALLGVALTLSCRVVDVFIPEIKGVDDNWEVSQSSHYYIYYRPGSETAEEIDYLRERLDLDFADIIKTLDVTYQNKISCYVYGSREDFEKNEHSRGAAHAFPELEKISGYHPQIRSSAKHESVHVITYWTIGTPKFKFLNEGLAEGAGTYFSQDGNWKSSGVHSWCRGLLEEDKLLQVSQLADNDFFQTMFDSDELLFTYYPYHQSASFVGFLIGQHGLDRFKSFYAKANRDNYRRIFSCAYGKSMEDFEAEWRQFLRTYEPSN